MQPRISYLQLPQNQQQQPEDSRNYSSNSSSSKLLHVLQQAV
jgi:hypothetical protein